MTLRLARVLAVFAIGAGVVALAGGFRSHAQDKKDEKGKDKAGEKGKKEGVLPFNGKAAAVDKAAK